MSRLNCARAQILQRMPRQRPRLGSSPCPPRSLHHLSARRGAFMTRPDSRVSNCQSSSSKHSSLSSIRAAQAIKNIHYYILWRINTHYYTFNGASHKTRYFLPPGVCHQRAEGWVPLIDIWSRSLHVSLCEVSAASPLQLIKLPNLMISDAPCTVEWIFSLQKYRRSSRFLIGNVMAYIEMNLRARASRRSRALILIERDVLFWRVICYYYKIQRAYYALPVIPAAPIPTKLSQMQDFRELYSLDCYVPRPSASQTGRTAAIGADGTYPSLWFYS